MGKPSKQQIAEAIIHSAQAGESMADFEARIAGLSRMSDAELAAMGIEPPSAATPAQSAAGAARRVSERRPTGRKGPRPTANPIEERTTRPPCRGHGGTAAAAGDDTPDTAKPARVPIKDVDPDPLAFDPASVRHRHDGWTAGRQRAFIAALAETGCVTEACAEVGITPRSAYRLREHAAAAGFRSAWAHAESMATARLTALAFERAVHGSVERIYRDGVLVEERHKPNDKLLMWLLSHRDPVTYGWLERPQREAPHASFYPHLLARSEMPGLLDQLADIDPAACRAEPVPPNDLDYDTSPPSA